jgi:hypothetical protein
MSNVPLSDDERRKKKAEYQREWRARQGARTGKHGPAPSAPCGTRSAYNRHLRSGESPCELCREANGLYQKSRRKRLRAS